jgi:hypothetical protein
MPLAFRFHEQLATERGSEARGYRLMRSHSIEELLDRIEKLGGEHLRTTEDAASLGITPKAAGEWEYIREQISRLIDRLAVLHKQPRIDARPHGVRTKPSDLPNKTRPSSEP